MSQRKKKSKQSKRQRQRSPKPGLFPKMDIPEGVKVIPTPTGAARMSEVILEFIEPYNDQWETPEELKKLLSLAAVAWNAALLTGEKREEMLRAMDLTFPPELRAEFRSIIEPMIQRKLQYFAGNTRNIIDFQVTLDDNGPRVAVLSTLYPDAGKVSPAISKRDPSS